MSRSQTVSIRDDDDCGETVVWSSLGVGMANQSAAERKAGYDTGSHVGVAAAEAIVCARLGVADA